MLAKVFVGLLGLLYAGLSVYCSLYPGKASKTVHLDLQGPGGQSEFLTVYGGLEMGMALVFLLPWYDASFTRSSLLAAVLIHGCLVAFRMTSVVLYPGAFAATQSLAIGEIVIFALALLLWLRGGV